MSIIFSAIVPHGPLLIPSIGKENTKRLKDTLKSYGLLEKELIKKKPETIVIISPHGLIQEKNFTINLSPEFEGSFDEFGDFSTAIKVKGNIALAYKIRERLETRAPLQLITEKKLDYGSSVPLKLLIEKLPKIKLLPIYYSYLDAQSHFDFGRCLQRELLLSKERIAVIASGDLSHRLDKHSPGGYSSKGKKFDKKIIELLKKLKINDILSLEKDLIQEAGECGYKSIVMLLGIMDGIKNTPNILSYESPFGIGYLTADLKL